MNTRTFQQGQALAESLLVFLLAGLLWIAIVQIGQLQDMAMQAQHASRTAAFAAAHGGMDVDTALLRQTHFSGTAHRWRDHAGRPMLIDPDTRLALGLTQTVSLAAQAQPGGSDTDSTILRRQWHLEDTGLVRADVALAVSVPFRSGQTGMTIRRHTSILRDAGYSPDAGSAQQRVAESAYAWGDAARRSQAAGERVQNALEKIDAPWHRPAPSYDWLMPWAGDFPGKVADE